MEAALTKKRNNPILPYLLILPTAIFVAMFTAWPTLLALYQSFFRQRLNIAKYRQPTFVGLENYTTLFSDERFLLVMKNTLIFILVTAPISIVLGLFFALLINRKLKGIGLARLAFFQPTILPMVSAATIWMFLFTPDYGLWNTFLQHFGYTGPQNWTGNPHLALIAIMIVSIWKNAGYYMIFYLAGLQNLPTDVYEAATLAGANWWQMLVKITLPLLHRTTLFVSIIAFIGAFQMVDHIFVLTKGGPSRASTVLLYYLWQMRFENQDVGKAAAITIILIAFLLIFTVSNFVLSERKEEEAHA